MEDDEDMDLTPQGRAALIELIDREMHRIEVMRAHGWPLTTPAELIPAAFRKPALRSAPQA